MTKLEKEVQESKGRRKNECTEENQNNTESFDTRKTLLGNNQCSTYSVPDLGSILVKHSSRFQREIEEARKKSSKEFEINAKKVRFTAQDGIPDLGSILIKHTSKLEKEAQELRANAVEPFDKSAAELGRGINRRKDNAVQVPSLDKFLVKHVGRLEREVQEAKNRSKNDLVEEENVNLNVEEDDGLTQKPDNREPTTEIKSNGSEESLDTILVKPVSRLEKEKMQASSWTSKFDYTRPRTKHMASAVADGEGLDKVLVKHVSRLEKEKMDYMLKEKEPNVKRQGRNLHTQVHQEGGLDQILVKPKSRLEKANERLVCARPDEEQGQGFVSRREARERELQEAWRGLSLGNSIRPHVSKLERDKAAWIKAEEDERRRALT